MFKGRLTVLLTAIFFVGCGLNEKSMAAENSSEQPIITVRCEVTQNARSDFFKTLQRFADANAFAMRTGFPGPSKDHITIQMWREDIKIVLVNPFSPEQFRISFYENGDTSSEDAIKSLDLRLRKELIAVKGVHLK